MGSQRRFILYLCIPLLLGACGTGSTHLASTAPTTPTPTVQAPTPTATVRVPTPTNVPTGWQVFSGPHFSIAYPADWNVTAVQQSSGGGQATAAVTGARFNVSAPGGNESILVSETYGTSSADIAGACANLGTHTTLADLPVISYALEGGAQGYMFPTRHNVVYTLIVPGPAVQPAAQADYTAIMATFRPVYTDSACG